MSFSVVKHESIKGEIFVTFHVQIFVFFDKWTKSGKEVIYGKKNECHRAFKRVKLLQSSQSDCLCALSRHCMTFLRRPGSTAIPWCHMLSRSVLVENVCTFSIVFSFVVCDAWRMRDMREKCAVAMGANVLNLYENFQQIDFQATYQSQWPDGKRLHFVTFRFLFLLARQSAHMVSMPLCWST